MIIKPRVYVAGKLNDMAIGYIKNIHAMIVEADRVRRAGFSVFVPCLDVVMGISVGGMEYEDYFSNSQPWLLVAHAVYVCPGWEASDGTKREIERAVAHRIPVFYDLEAMHRFFDMSNNKEG